MRARSRAWAGYRRLRAALPLTLVVYFAGGFSTMVLSLAWPRWRESPEVFPFYDWAMFSIVKPAESRFVVRVSRFRGKPLSPPRDLAELTDIEGLRAYALIGELGLAARDGRLADVARLRGELEAQYLPAPSAYAVVEETYDPLERWRTGRLAARVLLRCGEEDAP